MKYLRLFDSLVSLNYKEIDREEWNIADGMIDVSKKTIDIIESKIPGCILGIQNVSVKYTNNVEDRINIIIGEWTNINVNISEVEDEYFTVKLLKRSGQKEIFFKCDQITGLIECLYNNLILGDF